MVCGVMLIQYVSVEGRADHVAYVYGDGFVLALLWRSTNLQ
jgi:hypothetical protein